MSITENKSKKETATQAIKGSVKSKKKTITPPFESEAIQNKKTKRHITIALAIVLFAFSLFLLIALISYLQHWREDQVFSDLNMLKNYDGKALNACGRYGAYLGYILIGKWFGFTGVFIPIPLISLSIYLMDLSLKFMVKVTISTIGALLIFPTTISFITPYADPTKLGGGYGGGYGVYLHHQLDSTVGVAGTIIILLLAFCSWLIYTLPFSLRVFSAITHKVRRSADKIGKTINRTDSFSETENKPPHSNPATTKDTKESQAPVSPKDTLQINKNQEKIIFTPSDTESENTVIINMNDIDKNINEFLSTGDNSTEEIPFTIKINNPTENEDVPESNYIANNDIVQGTTTSSGGFISKIDGDINNFPLINPVSSKPESISTESEKSKYDFKVSITDSTILDVNTELVDTKIDINEVKEINDDEFEQEIYDPTKELSNYKLPPLDLLNNTVTKVSVSNEELRENIKKIVDTLGNFNIKIDDIEATIGPTVTLYEIKPAPGIRIQTIKRLEDDIALSLAAHGIRIIAPIPGKDTVGIEVPNKNKEIVSMHSVIKSVDFQESNAELPIVLGKTIQNKPYIADLAKMPHLLVAGATGQGKSVGLNAIITSLLYKKHPAELKFVMVDPKKVEFSLYSALDKHYLAKLPDEDDAIIIDTQKVIYTLNSLCLEMDSRYELLKKAKVRNIIEYNNKFKDRRLNPNNGHKFLPYFVVIIDEFGDLILTAGKEIEVPLTRLAALARAVGIHLVIATQRPTTNIITGTIKANFPARMAFRVMSGIDSKTILDATGASQLIGKGDMLIISNNDTTRVQCAFIDTPEVERITDFIEKQVGYGSPYSLPEFKIEEKGQDSESKTISQRDALFDKVARYVVSNQQGSASTIQRNFEIGFNRAGRIMDQLERAGIVGKQVGSKPRQVLILDLTQLELQLINIDNPPYGR